MGQVVSLPAVARVLAVRVAASLSLLRGVTAGLLLVPSPKAVARQSPEPRAIRVSLASPSWTAIARAVNAALRD